MWKEERAKELRKQMTEAEEKAWCCLRDRRLGGFKFRRQHVIAGYIVDFYCAECRLVLELDGGVHTTNEQREYDEHRDGVLMELALRVVRVANKDIGEPFFCELLRALEAGKKV